jgi:hypothetical protein
MNWKKRNFVLQAFTLIYKDLDGNKKGEISLEGCTVAESESPGRDFCFAIKLMGR